MAGRSWLDDRGRRGERGWIASSGAGTIGLRFYSSQFLLQTSDDFGGCRLRLQSAEQCTDLVQLCEESIAIGSPQLHCQRRNSVAREPERFDFSLRGSIDQGPLQFDGFLDEPIGQANPWFRGTIANQNSKFLTDDSMRFANPREQKRILADLGLILVQAASDLDAFHQPVLRCQERRFRRCRGKISPALQS